MLYHTYLGKNTQRSRRVPQGDCTLSQFLEKNLTNLEYQDRLEKELSNLMEEEKQRKEVTPSPRGREKKPLIVEVQPPPAQEEAKAEAMARLVMSRAPLAIRQHKRLLAQSIDADFETVLNLEKQTISNLIFTEDYGEALKAFADKRKPRFKGR